MTTEAGTARSGSGPVKTANVTAFDELIELLLTRDPAMPGFGVFYGPAGVGKTYAAINATLRQRAWHVELKSCVTRAGLTEAILSEMGVDPKGRAGTIEARVDRIGEILGDHPSRPLILDEADHLAHRNVIEIVRDIYRRAASSGAAIVLIGESNFPLVIRKWERVDSRVLARVQAKPIELDDVRLLAKRILGAGIPSAAISEEALAAVAAEASGSARRAVVELYRLRQTLVLERLIEAIDVEHLPEHLRRRRPEAAHAG